MTEKEWIAGHEGRNLKFKRETLLNYGMNRWGLNKASSVGPTSELIRTCAPKVFDEWEKFYFSEARQKKANGIQITREYIEDLDRKLFVKISEVVQNEVSSITEEECMAYAYNLVLNRTYEGYRREIDTIYGQLQDQLGCRIEPAPDEWDRKYCVDFYIQIKQSYVGLQIKPVATGKSINDYQWEAMHQEKHAGFTKKFGGNVFFIYSTKTGERKQICNVEVIDSIRAEIARLEHT